MGDLRAEQLAQADVIHSEGPGTYLKDMPYCDTCSKPVFQTRVTSQALVACNLHDRKAETGLPPTVTTFISS